MLPQAQAVLATEICDALQKDGRVTVVATPELADAVLRVSIVGTAGTSRPQIRRHRPRTRIRPESQGFLYADRSPHREALLHQSRAQVSKNAFTDSGQLQSE